MNEKLSNPAPLGLLGFGMTTVLLNVVHNARLGPLDAMILAMGIFYGGVAQIIAGILEYRKGNTFGTTAFTSYGLFWLSFVGLIWLGSAGPAEAGVWPFLGTLKLNRALQFVFMSLAVLFWLLAIKSALIAFGGMTAAQLAPFTVLTGIEGTVCGFSAVYLAIAEVLNEVYGRTVLPIGPVQK